MISRRRLFPAVYDQTKMVKEEPVRKKNGFLATAIVMENGKHEPVEKFCLAQLQMTSNSEGSKASGNSFGPSVKSVVVIVDSKGLST
jgi:hypothetical protein